MENAPDIEKVNLIEPSQLLKKINQRESLVVIDVRTSDEYDLEHIVNSQNWTKDNSLLVKENIIPGKDYIIVDSNYSPYGKEVIESLGYPDNMFYLVGGFDGWKEGYYPTISIGDPESIIDRSKTNESGFEDLKKMISENQNVVLIDVRTEEEFQEERLKGAINIPLDKIEEEYTKIPFGDVFFVYAGSAFEAFQGSVRLYDLNFFSVKYSQETFQILKNNGLETESSKNPE